MKHPGRSWLSFLSVPTANQVSAPRRGSKLHILVGFIIFMLIFLEMDAWLLKGIHTFFVTAFHPVDAVISAARPVQAKNGDWIGISSGEFVFDTYPGRQQVSITSKKQAGEAIATDISKAEALWNNALQYDPEDAEARIYLENQDVVDANVPFFSLFVAVSFSNDDFVHESRETLQGAYVAQYEWNQQHQRGPRMRLLIANAGRDAANATLVALQIIRQYQADPTAIALIGWPSSAFTLNAISVLNRSHILMISQMSSADTLSGKGSNFFRIVPQDKEETAFGAQYAYTVKRYRRAAIFENPNSLYSQNLAEDFLGDFQRAGGSVVSMQSFDPDHLDALPRLLRNALDHNPDFIYFSGDSSTLKNLLTILPTEGAFASLRVLSGDTGYALLTNQRQNIGNIARLSFISFTPPSTWNLTYIPPVAKTFFSDYSTIFQTLHTYTMGEDTGYALSSFTLLSYDAMLVLLHAYQQVLSPNSLFQKQEDLQNTLMQVENSGTLLNALITINTRHPLQGVSGLIAFNSKHNVVNRMLFMVGVDAKGQLRVESSLGCFQVEQCPSP